MEVKKWKSAVKKIGNHANEKENKQESIHQDSPNHVTDHLALTLEVIKNEIGHNSDVHFREFIIGRTGIQAAIIFVEGLSDKDLIEKHILSSLMADFSKEYQQDQLYVKGSLSKQFIKSQVLSISDVEEVHSIKEVISKVLTGSTALLIDGLSLALILGTSKLKTRTIEEPVSEALVRGPRVGFTESLSDNTSLLRGSGDIENLSLVKFQVGKRSKKDLIVAYIKEIVDPELVEEVEKRIKKIDLDNVPESGYVEQLIEDNYLSPFPQVQNTERPDRVIAALMEGRVAILLDGTPFALIAPVTFSMMLQSPEDYYERWIPGTFIRFLRYIAVVLSLFTPALYIAFI
jgi:spore germination protein